MRAWRTRESRFVREHWGRLSVDEMARELGRSWQSVYKHGTQTLGLGSPRMGVARTRWSREDETLLEMLSMRGVPMELAGAVLGRTAEACRLRSYEIKRRKSE